MSIEQNELRFTRVITGQTDPRTGVTFPAKGCIPTPIAQSGQFTSNGVNVFGDVDTNFAAEVNVDDFIYCASLNEVRQVREVKAEAKQLVLEYGFSSNIAVAEDFYVVKSGKFKRIRIKNVHASAAGVLQGVPFAVGEEEWIEFDLGISPITYDATSASFSISLSE